MYLKIVLAVHSLAWFSVRPGPRFRRESIRAVIRAIPLLRESKLIRVSDTMIKNT